MKKNIGHGMFVGFVLVALTLFVSYPVYAQEEDMGGGGNYDYTPMPETTPDIAFEPTPQNYAPIDLGGVGSVPLMPSPSSLPPSLDFGVTNNYPLNSEPMNLATPPAYTMPEIPVSYSNNIGFTSLAPIDLAGTGSVPLIPDAQYPRIDAFNGTPSFQELAPPIANLTSPFPASSLEIAFDPRELKDTRPELLQGLLRGIPEKRWASSIASTIADIRGASVSSQESMLTAISGLSRTDPLFEKINDAMVNSPFSNRTLPLVDLYGKGSVDITERPFAFKPDVLKEIIYNNSYAEPDDYRPVALVIGPAKDWNGGFNELGKGSVGQLIENGYRVNYGEIGNTLEPFAKLTNTVDRLATETPKIIVVQGHGGGDVIALREVPLDNSGGYAQSVIAYGDKNANPALFSNTVNLLSRYADSNTTVVVESCSAGIGGSNGRNMVNFFRDVFPDAKAVIGPAGDAAGTTLQFDPKNQNLTNVVFGKTGTYINTNRITNLSR
ncbi:MAG: hypothetical protein NT088_02950 [Candidatus Omnitrophica bacterium]|nr:hypothetical protein [Candidatus Omnitrophota bacterium]